MTRRAVGSQLLLSGVGSCGSPNSALALSQKPDPVGSWELGARHWNVNGEMQTGVWENDHYEQAFAFLPEADRLLLAITHNRFSCSHCKGT